LGARFASPGCAGLPLKDLWPRIGLPAVYLSTLSKDDDLTGLAGVVAPSLALGRAVGVLLVSSSALDRPAFNYILLLVAAG
jgi:hypothetical protein